jgi:hypothetical protein
MSGDTSIAAESSIVDTQSAESTLVPDTMVDQAVSKAEHAAMTAFTDRVSASQNAAVEMHRLNTIARQTNQPHTNPESPRVTPVEPRLEQTIALMLTDEQLTGPTANALREIGDASELQTKHATLLNKPGQEATFNDKLGVIKESVKEGLTKPNIWIRIRRFLGKDKILPTEKQLMSKKATQQKLVP